MQLPALTIHHVSVTIVSDGLISMCIKITSYAYGLARRKQVCLGRFSIRNRTNIFYIFRIQKITSPAVQCHYSNIPRLRDALYNCVNTRPRRYKKKKHDHKNNNNNNEERKRQMKMEVHYECV